MDLLKKLSVIASIAIACPAADFGYFSKHDAGQEVFSFLSSFDSPRNAALEKSASALPTTDPSIVQLNPAAVLIAEGKKRVAEAHWQTGEFASNQGSLSYTTQYQKFILQFSYNWISYGSITGYDEYGQETGKEYKPFSQLTTATVTYPMKHIRVGATLKFASDKLTGESGDQTALAAAFDWGLTWMSNSKNYGISFVARDFGAMIRGYVKKDADDSYPWSYSGRCKDGNCDFTEKMGFHWTSATPQDGDKNFDSNKGDSYAVIIVEKEPDYAGEGAEQKFFQVDSKAKFFSVRCVQE